MTLQEFEAAYASLGSYPKTKDIDTFNKGLIRRKVDVSFLAPVIREHQEYYRTYYQVSLANRLSIEEKMAFIEENFALFSDWWHTDMLMPFLGKRLTFDYALCKARQYVQSEQPYVRRWGYVMFIPRLVKDPEQNEALFSLFHNDDVYHVVMAQAWLLSYLAMCDTERTWHYLKNCGLNYDIVGKAIQKICDSYQFSPEEKERFKQLREYRRCVK